MNADSEADIIWIPDLSDDLSDPLRWSAWRKTYHLFLLVMYSTLMTALGNWEAPIGYINIRKTLGTTITLMNVGSALTLLMLGIGNVFLTPLSHSEYQSPLMYPTQNIKLTNCRIWSKIFAY